MSLNWKEINLILEELDLPGSQIQKATQSAFDVIGLRVHKKGVTRQLLIALSPGACRMHETFKPFPKSDKPLRFAQFLNSRIVNGWIEEAQQLGTNRIIRLLVKKGEYRYNLYVRLWSNAANFIVTDEDGNVLDAMRRLPKKSEVTGGHYVPPEEKPENENREYAIREFPELPNIENNSFNAKIDAFYAEKGGALSLEALKEQARRNCEGSIGRLQAALEKLKAKEADYASADRLREYGDIILANIAAINPGDEWLEADNFYADSGAVGGKIRIKLTPTRAHPRRLRFITSSTQKRKTALTISARK